MKNAKDNQCTECGETTSVLVFHHQIVTKKGKTPFVCMVCMKKDPLKYKDVMIRLK